jgi:hypothetical protein
VRRSSSTRSSASSIDSAQATAHEGGRSRTGQARRSEASEHKYRASPMKETQQIESKPGNAARVNLDAAEATHLRPKTQTRHAPNGV